MLVLSRHLGESVMVGDDVEVVVVAIKGDKVRLAFDAPNGIIIHRKEVYDEIKDRNETQSGD